MTDYRALAKAIGLKAEPDQIERNAAVLEALESAMAELKKKLPADAEPAPVFSPYPSREGA